MLRTAHVRLTPWKKVPVARHPERPHALEYIERLFEEYRPLSGDRAIVGGLSRFDGCSVVVIGNEKGHDTESRLAHDSGVVRYGPGIDHDVRRDHQALRLYESEPLPMGEDQVAACAIGHGLPRPRPEMDEAERIDAHGARTAYPPAIRTGSLLSWHSMAVSRRVQTRRRAPPWARRSVPVS